MRPAQIEKFCETVTMDETAKLPADGIGASGMDHPSFCFDQAQGPDTSYKRFSLADKDRKEASLDMSMTSVPAGWPAVSPTTDQEAQRLAALDQLDLHDTC